MGKPKIFSLFIVIKLYNASPFGALYGKFIQKMQTDTVFGHMVQELWIIAVTYVQGVQQILAKL